MVYNRYLTGPTYIYTYYNGLGQYTPDAATGPSEAGEYWRRFPASSATSETKLGYPFRVNDINMLNGLRQSVSRGDKLIWLIFLRVSL